MIEKEGIFMALPLEKYYTVEDFYDMPEDIRAELIEGQIVYMASPNTQHQRILGQLYLMIGNYINSKGGDCEVFLAPYGVQLRDEEDTVVEPDISVICDPDKITKRGCVGAPDWVIEIVSPSNPKHDYITKLSLYSNAGVREYWIIDAEQNKIHVYNIQDNKLVLNSYTFQDTIKVGIYEDFYIDFSSLNL